MNSMVESKSSNRREIADDSITPVLYCIEVEQFLFLLLVIDNDNALEMAVGRICLQNLVIDRKPSTNEVAVFIRLVSE